MTLADRLDAGEAAQHQIVVAREQRGVDLGEDDQRERDRRVGGAGQLLGAHRVRVDAAEIEQLAIGERVGEGGRGLGQRQRLPGGERGRERGQRAAAVGAVQQLDQREPGRGQAARIGAGLARRHRAQERALGVVPVAIEHALHRGHHREAGGVVALGRRRGAGREGPQPARDLAARAARVGGVLGQLPAIDRVGVDAELGRERGAGARPAEAANQPRTEIVVIRHT